MGSQGDFLSQVCPIKGHRRKEYLAKHAQSRLRGLLDLCCFAFLEVYWLHAVHMARCVAAALSRKQRRRVLAFLGHGGAYRNPPFVDYNCGFRTTCLHAHFRDARTRWRFSMRLSWPPPTPPPQVSRTYGSGLAGARAPRWGGRLHAAGMCAFAAPRVAIWPYASL